MEKYMAFLSGNNLVFIVSFQLLSSSLEKLVANLPQEAFKNASNKFGKKTKYMTRKGVYPYYYMDSFDKFNDTKLPSKDQFYSILNDEHVTNEQLLVGDVHKLIPTINRNTCYITETCNCISHWV